MVQSASTIGKSVWLRNHHVFAWAAGNVLLKGSRVDVRGFNAQVRSF
jgi:hypothetical protein